MQQYFVEYPLAQKLKEAGFDELCLAYYTNTGIWVLNSLSPLGELNTLPLNEKQTAAPIYQQVFDWLETKMLFVKWWCNYKTGMCTVRITNEKDYILWMAQEGEEPKLYPSKKAAWDAGIEQALELLKKKS